MKTKYFTNIVLIVFMACTAPRPDYIELSETNPSRFVADQDSLLAAEPGNIELVEALVNAHLILASQMAARGNKKAAWNEYLSVLDLNEKNVDANYYLAMVRGQESFQKGSRKELWDAIEEFSRAVRYLPSQGEPHYWVGRAYEKKDDGDFDLIVESYERALILELTEDQRNDCELRLEKARKRQETFENFWKK